MINQLMISPWRVVLATSLGTGLAIIGDTSLYTVLPTHINEAGVTLASVGILLSANRFIRLGLNGPMGFLYDRYSRRYLFVTSVFMGAASTAIYALTQGFGPLLVGRLLWGLSWAGIWVGGNALILDVTDEHNRGRWVGIYQISFFLGAATGAIGGGFLTDMVGYHRTMGTEAALGFIGVILALVILPDVPRLQREKQAPPTMVTHYTRTTSAEMASAMGLLGVNRLLIAGMLLPTFSLFLLAQVGQSVQWGGFVFGVATLTGLALGANSLVAMLASPLFGRWSDLLRTRWHSAAVGIGSGIIGFIVLTLGSPLALIIGIPLTAVAGGSGQGLATTIVGDLSKEGNRGKNLGFLFTIGDLASAVAPPLVFWIMPLLGVAPLYLLGAGIYAILLFVALRWVILGRRSVADSVV